MANVIIDIAAEFTGKKGFKQAETATDKMSKNVKKLAGALGLAFGTAQVIAFGKASVKAFAEDEAAATRLTKSLQNLGLGFEDARVKTFIQDLESSAHVSDDVLRPAFQSLLQTTGSVAKSQELLSLALDVSAGSGIDAAQVSQDLALAYLGQTKGLSKYELGLSKAELQSASFNKIQGALNDQFTGQNAARLDTYAGKMDAINLALGNAQETIGEGLVDAFAILAGDTGIGSVTESINQMALAASESIVSISKVVAELQKIPVVGSILSRLQNPLGLPEELLVFGQGGLLDEFRAYGRETRKYGGAAATKYLAEVEAAAAAARKKAEEEARKRAQELLKIKNKQLENEKKQLAAKKLAAVIDKANLALNKGQEVFDMDRIQIAAALANQAEQLGKATDASQALQIANDTARLNVKKSILALEDAIAAKDEASIVAATNKLNADLKVLGALSGQSLKLSDIKSILESLKPADLINLANLDAAIAKMMELLKLQGTKTLTPTQGNTSVPSAVSTPSAISSPTAVAELMTGIGSNLKEFTILTDGIANSFQKIEDVGAFNALANMYAGGAINPFNAGSFRMAEGGSTFSSGAVGSRDINITVNTGVGDPNAIAEAIDNVLREARDRGTLTIL